MIEGWNSEVSPSVLLTKLTRHLSVSTELTGDSLPDMTLLHSLPAEPQTCHNSASSVESLIVSSPAKSPVKCPFEEMPEKLDKAIKVEKRGTRPRV